MCQVYQYLAYVAHVVADHDLDPILWLSDVA